MSKPQVNVPNVGILSVARAVDLWFLGQTNLEDARERDDQLMILNLKRYIAGLERALMNTFYDPDYPTVSRRDKGAMFEFLVDTRNGIGLLILE